MTSLDRAAGLRFRRSGLLLHLPHGEGANASDKPNIAGQCLLTVEHSGGSSGYGFPVVHRPEQATLHAIPHELSVSSVHIDLVKQCEAHHS